MSIEGRLKAKLGWDVFKPGGEPHIWIKPGMERDSRLKRMIGICPAGLYSEGEAGAIVLTVEGCLECGACRLACGTAVLEWRYPDGGTGVQFRYG
jgi:ferredoxin like protein